jgi:hypothetical protein
MCKTNTLANKDCAKNYWTLATKDFAKNALWPTEILCNKIALWTTEIVQKTALCPTEIVPKTALGSMVSACEQKSLGNRDCAKLHSGQQRLCTYLQVSG